MPDKYFELEAINLDVYVMYFDSVWGVGSMGRL